MKQFGRRNNCTSSVVKQNKRAFRCPECENGEHDGFFCTLHNCPEQIPQPKFPSATSSFPPEELAEINECIEQANELLLALGLERDPENLRILQLSLRKLRNRFVSVIINCNEEQHKVKGHLMDAGLDFIILETNVGNFLIIPSERISLLEHTKQKEMRPLQEQELLEIDPCLRRSLTFHFGEVVAKSPFLINLFYGLKLRLFLESYVGCFAYVKAENNERELDGELIKVDNRRIELQIDDEIHGFDFDELCFIELEREALARMYLLCNEHPIFL